MLDKIADTMVAHLSGETIENIDVRSLSKMKEKLSMFGNIVDYLIPILRDALKGLNGTELYVDGISNLLSTFEFSETEKAKNIFDFLKDESQLVELFDSLPADKLSIKIGTEIGVDLLDDCSIVASSYLVDGNNAGRILVLGPKRMDYGSIVSTVNYISNTLSDVFSGIYL